MSEKDETLELYRVMVETVTANEQRRQQISAVFITLIAAGFAAVGAISDFELIYVTVPAAFISIVWWSQLRYLKRLASAKFHVIGQLENKLSYRPFEEEWRFLKKIEEEIPDGPKVLKMLRNIRMGLSQIEMTVPLVIFLASVGHILFSILFAFGVVSNPPLF